MLKSSRRILFDRVQLCSIRVLAQYTTELYPYTSSLYKKNYIRYPVQSKNAVTHDYVFTGDERLPTLAQRLKDFQDPIDLVMKNIGKKVDFSALVNSLNERIEKTVKENKANRQMEIDSRDAKLIAPLDEISKVEKIFSGFKHIQSIAGHYNIYKDLFKNAYFLPSLDLSVKYPNNQETTSVFYGNKIPAQADTFNKPKTVNKPEVSWEDFTGSTNNSSYHSLAFINLDGNFKNSENHVLLWFISNIKNGDLKTGSELLEYIQPFPMRGTGWHRCAFLLFEHSDAVDFDLKLPKSDQNFLKRDFKCWEFVLAHQEKITPVGLSFFQTTWDLSVKKVFHNYLDMKEPVYKFEFEPKFVPKFEKYPRDEPPFNWYLHEYMDKKDMSEEVTKEYLKELNPFEPYPEPAKYPLIDLKHYKPRWYKYEEINKRKRRLQYEEVPFKYSSPIEKTKNYIKSLPFNNSDN